jgi:predicted RNA binding protein YcfA (HicA-like mRNA interferase family)
MTSSIKLCSGAEAVKKFRRAGWRVDRQEGSHMMMVKANYQYTLSIPLQRELGIGILKKLNKQTGLSVDKFDRL